MRRSLCLTLSAALLAGLMLPAVVRAADEKSPLSIIPDDTIAFVCVQNLKRMDDRLGQVRQILTTLAALSALIAALLLPGGQM